MGRISLHWARGLAMVAGLAALTAFDSTAQAGGYEDLQRCSKMAERINASSAIEVCTAAIQSGELTQANTAIGYYNRGNAYRRLGQYEDAVRDFSKAIELWPDLDHAWNNRGGAYARLCKADLALADFEKAMELNPDWVARYQEALDNAGVKVGSVDGKYGPQTRGALLSLIEAQCERQ